MSVRSHNDYTGLEPTAEREMTAAVVIPVYERPDQLERTLAGLERSTYPALVVVADDGSQADIESVVQASPLDTVYVRQDHDGYGAGRARNLGVAQADVDLVVFIDADCIPDPELVERHVAWHAAGGSLVTIGARRHVRVADVDPARISAGDVDLERRAQSGFTGREDFRRLLERRTSKLRTGDEAFRTLVSSNVAMRRSLFLDAGGFDERFRRWGGEDTELGWRLWQRGALFVPADEAVVHHQLDDDRSGGHGGRRRSRSLNDGTIATLIPHSFYRKPRRDVLYEVPKVSVVVHRPPPDLDLVWSDIAGQTAPDLQAVLCGLTDRHEPTAGLLAGDPRVELADDLEAGIEMADGELVMTVHGSVALDHRTVARIVKHFHDRPTTSSLTVGYTLPSDPVEEYRNQPDAAWIDLRWSTGLPLVTVARRRDWAKTGPGDPAARWSEIRRLERPDHLAQGLAWIPSTDAAVRPADFAANRPTRAEMLADLRSHPRRAVETTARILRARSRGTPYSIPTAPGPEPDPSGSGPVRARYVGWVGYDNLGDEAMLEATRRLVPWADVQVSGPPQDLLLLGGGTLINRSTYLAWLEERDSPRIERAVLGTGVASPEYWGETEPVEGWLRWLSSCAYVGVRGPRSAETLASWGYDGPFEVCGDPALLFERPPEVATEEGAVVVSPAWTDGELWGRSDEKVLAELAAATREWLDDGRTVTFLSCNPADDRPIFELMRDVGRPDLPYVAGYRSLDDALAALAAAELVVAERLHAAVLAAAVGTPFVAVEYRPKLDDFAASVGADAVVVRTDDITAEAVFAAGAEATTLAPTVANRVRDHRARLTGAADLIRSAVRPGEAP